MAVSDDIEPGDLGSTKVRKKLKIQAQSTYSSFHRKKLGRETNVFYV